MKKIAPQVKILFSEDAGHDVAIVKPEWVNEEVLKFLKNQ